MSTQDYAPEEMESALNKRAELEVPEAGRSERSEQVRAEGRALGATSPVVW